MQPEVAKQLIELNHQFYQTFAAAFSATRQRLQPGVVRVLDAIPRSANILDVGCGNGLLAHELAKRGHKGSYLGLDFSDGLLDAARQDAPEFAAFKQANLTSSNWDADLKPGSYDFILAFAVMHHIPSKKLHLQILSKIQTLLAPKGSFIHSNWQPLNSERLKARIQPWEKVGLRDAIVDSGDCLLDWRRDGSGLRYVHQFSEQELKSLASKTGFVIQDTFYSDGEGGKLGLYGVWGLQE